MEQGNTPKAILYLAMLGFFFFFLYSLDNFFGLHYQPNEHRLNQKKTAAEHEPAITKEEVNKGDVHFEGVAEEETDKEVVKEAPAEVSHEPEQIEEEGETKDFFDQLMSGYKEEVLSKLPAHKARTDVTLRYYHHAPDGNSAYALEKLGFYIHERPVDEEYADFQSNAIYIGDSVSTEDVQIVGYTLLQHGLPIKVITSSKFADSWKSHSIEIGTDTTLVDLPTLTLENIRNFKH